MSKLLTPKDVAARANISESLVYALLKAGRIPGLRVGCRGRGKWLTREEDFDAFLASCTVAVREADDEGDLKHIKVNQKRRTARKSGRSFQT